MTFVILSLASWFGVLGLFGRYLPANAVTMSKQVTINMRGNQLTSHWVKKNGRWQFQRLSKISKLPNAGYQRTATTQNPKNSRKQRWNGPRPLSAEPQTTASINPSLQRKLKKKALRAALAKEIGRWAKIGNRWEWRPVVGSLKVSQQLRQMTIREPSEGFIDHQLQIPQAHWVRQDGSWRFEVLDERFIIRHI